MQRAVPLSSTPALLSELNLRVLEMAWVGIRMHDPRCLGMTWTEGADLCVPKFKTPELLENQTYRPQVLAEGGLRLSVDLFCEPNELFSWYQSLNSKFLWVFVRVPHGPGFRIMKVVGKPEDWHGGFYFRTTEPHVENHDQRDDWTDGRSRVALTVGKRYHIDTVVYYGRKHDPRILAFHMTEAQSHTIRASVIHMFKLTAGPQYLQQRVENKLGRAS